MRPAPRSGRCAPHNARKSWPRCGGCRCGSARSSSSATTATCPKPRSRTRWASAPARSRAMPPAASPHCARPWSSPHDQLRARRRLRRTAARLDAERGGHRHARRRRTFAHPAAGVRAASPVALAAPDRRSRIGRGARDRRRRRVRRRARQQRDGSAPPCARPQPARPHPPPPGGPPDAPTPEPTPSQTSTVPVVHAAFPKRAIFPFTSAKDERAWEQESAQGHSPWQGDAKAVATFWVTNFLQLSSVNQVVRQGSSPTKVDVTLGRMQADASAQRQIPVTTVHLVKYGKAWIVTGATDDSRLLRITSPTAGATVTSPLVASGPGGGIHRAADVQVRDATTPTKYGEGHTGSFGTTQGWSATVPFATPSKPVGVLLVVESSEADGLPLRITAQQVRFGTSSVTAGPQYFYGIRSGRVTKFSATAGASLDYLTDPKPGGGASDPQLVGNDVYFLRGNGSCANSLSKVSSQTSDNTQPEHSVATPDDGYVITGYAIFHGENDTSGTRYSFFEQACDGATSPQAKLVSIEGGARHVVKFESMPPMIVADPSYEPPAALQFLDAIVRTGTSARFVRYDTANTTSPTGARNACRGWDFNNGRPWALETDATGTMWFATQSGSSMQVVKCSAGGDTAVVAFTVPGNNQPADVDISSSGSVLLTDTDGEIWRWNGSGNAVKLSPSQPITDATW